ncbi:PAS domain S-box protein [Paenibacillus sp. HWE-109]|uniref:PAS domain S-box protein n=1 Tax=Paenibacillus sp. HWE-109 TaxID=1306526 RepID=UPI001EDDB5A6|nr:PAS domain S-box protein [Paenibacillus sp. HWE-109]UKS27144.1 PAS domain S-box protein [Paenibacillus sp. HWE-109]
MSLLMKINSNGEPVFEQVFNLAPNAIALAGIDGKIGKVNEAFTQTLGYSQQMAAEMTLEQLVLPEDLQSFRTCLEEAHLQNERNHELEIRCISNNGSLIWKAIKFSLVRDGNGDPHYFILHLTTISPPKGKEQKLEGIDHWYDLIFKNARDIITLVNPDGTIEYLSPSICDLLGYDPEELVGKNSNELNHPEDMAMLQSVILSDQPTLTYRARHKNGTYVWLETATKLIHDAEGRLQKILGIGRDVTERKTYQDSLAEAQHIAALGSWEIDFLEEKIAFSEEFYRIYQISKSDLPSDPTALVILVHPEDRGQFQTFINQAKQLRQGPTSLEFRNLQSDGTVKYMQIRVSVLFDEEGKPIKMSGTTQDITERKKAELNLQESVERYTSLKKYNHDAVISLDVKGTIINTNDMAAKLTGFSISEMRGENISKFIGEQNVARILSGVIEDVTAERHINAIKHKDGAEIEVLATIAPIIINKKNVGYYVIAKDMTEQKTLLIAKEAAEKTNKAKSEFLAMMSHEIRTPMNGVIGMTDLLLHTTELDEEQKEYVQIIHKSGNTLITIINDILDFSKIEAGKTVLQQQAMDIRDCISETRDILFAKAQEKNLSIDISVSPKIPYTLIGDYDRIKQILLNLLSNAIKFTYNGGVSIVVENGMSECKRRQLQFTIKDTGIGIPKEKLEHLFNPFYQLDSFMTRKSEGTGLGLAISKKLVGLMDGDIWVEHTDELGATFVCTIWLKEHEQAAALTPFSIGEDMIKQRPLNILIAEDNEINQITLRKMIEKMGHNTSIAENGNQVIRALAYESYDIIFMDIRMPELSGLEATKQIKANMPPEKTPFIIAVTANALMGDREKCLEAGMDDYISKPIKSGILFEMIEKYERKLLHMRG